MSLRAKISSVLAVVGLCAAVTPMLVHSQVINGYPDKPIKLIVPFPAGGLVDGIARTLAPELAKIMGQSVVIDNRSGASGSIGAAVVAQAPADGYTLLMVLDTHAINPIVYKKLAYDTEKAFAPISLIARAPMVAVANENVPANSLAELVRYAKANPDKINYGSVGPGSASHLTAEMFNAKADIRTTHVPYKGGAPAQTDLMAGQIQLMWGTAPYAQTLVRAGRLKALGQASATRSVAFPNLPTTSEQGIADFEAYGWIGMLAPAGTPDVIVSKWNSALEKVTKNPEVSKKLTEQGFELVVSTPAEFGDFIRKEHHTWRDLIATKGIPLE